MQEIPAELQTGVRQCHRIGVAVEIEYEKPLIARSGAGPTHS